MKKFKVFIIMMVMLLLNTITINAQEVNYLDVLYDNLGGLSTSEANDIEQTNDGYIWIGSYSSLTRYDGKEFVSITEPNKLTSILTLFKDNEGRLWIGTNNDGVAVYDDGTFTFIEFSNWEYATPLSIMPYQEDTIFIGTAENYVLEYNLDSGEATKISTGTLTYINAMIEMENGDIWIGSDTGIGYLDQNKQLYVFDYLKMNNSIENFTVDHEGNIWVASSRQGVLKMSVNIFENLSAKLDGEIEITGVEMLGDYIYIVSESGPQIIDKNTLEEVENDFTTMLDGVYIRCIDQDFEGNLWLSTYSDYALIKYNPETGDIEFFNSQNGLDYSRIRSSMSASNGDIWVATGNGVYTISNNEVVAHYGTDEGIANLEILTLSEDGSGRIFAGTDGAGIYIIENGEVSTHIYKKTGLSSDIVLRTEYDAINDGIWVVTGTSIDFIDSEGNINTIEKFPYGNNFDIIVNDTQIVVLSSNGIFITTSESMLSDDSELEYTHKNHLHGLYSNSVVNSFSKIYDDVLYICGSENLSALNLYSEIQYSAPIMDILSITVDDESVVEKVGDIFDVAKEVDYMTFDVIIPTYTLQDFNVSYQLIGYDAQPRVTSYADFQNPVYSYVGGGEYVFYVKIIDKVTQEEISSTSATVFKEYKFQEQPYFRTLEYIFIICLVWVSIYFIFKTKSIKLKKEKEKMLVLFQEIVVAFSKVIDAKDGYTNGHSKRVAVYTREIARALGFSENDVISAYGVGMLHDVGKITIPDVILNKPDKLTHEEFLVMKEHAINGSEILQNITILPDIAIGAKYHHERYDGKGYLSGLKGEEIPLIARIICVADAFDAMYSSRVYRKKLKLDQVIEEIESNKGTQFDPEIADTFIKLIRDGKLDEVLREFRTE